MRHQRTFRTFPTGKIDLPGKRFQGVGSKGALLGIALLLALSAAAVAHADDQIRAVRLSNVVGGVQILAGTETQFSQAYPNMPLMQGSTLKTGEDGRAEIQLEDGSVIRLTPNSSAAMTVLDRNSEGNANTEIDLLTGLSYVEMKGTANQRFVIHFDGNEVISPAPAKFRVNLDANPNEFAVLDGSAHLSKGTDYAVDVHANETVRLDGGDNNRYFVAQGVDADSWDQWNVDRDQAMGQMAAQQTREAIGSGNGGAGWSDLDYYGNWYASNDGTSFWMPDGAAAGWDPYGSGSWGYYGNTGGYVWISGYPWGWLPYHCGTWNYFNTLNSWGWIPGGGCWNTWYPGSGIRNVPPGYHRLPRPTMPITHPLQGGHPVLNRNLIAVDRGPVATTLTPRVDAVPRAVAIGDGTARLLPKTPNPEVARTSRPAYPVYARTPYGATGGQQLGNVPVYRPTAPTAGSTYRPTAPSFSHAGGGASPSAPSVGVSRGGGGAPSAPAPSGGGRAH